MSGPSKFWIRHDAALRQMLEDEGLSASQAARRLGTTKNSVLSRARRRGFVLRHPPVWERPERAAPPPRVMFPGKGECVWPIGDPRDPDFHFCGAETKEYNGSYCAEHAGARRRAKGGERG